MASQPTKLSRELEKQNPRETNLRVLKHVWKIPHLCIMLKAIRMFMDVLYFWLLRVLPDNDRNRIQQIGLTLDCPIGSGSSQWGIQEKMD